MTSIVVSDICERIHDNTTIRVAYLYCNIRMQREQKVDDLLANLLKQLAQGQRSLPSSVEDLYKQHKKKETLQSLHQTSIALRSVIRMYKRVFIIVDALDECQTSNRTGFLSELFSIQKEVQKVNILVTSRFIPEIVDQFKNSPRLEIRADSRDVARYLEGHIQQLPSFVRQNRQLQQEIKKGIVETVDGMYVPSEYLK